MRRVMGAVGTVILEILKWILRIILGALKLVLGLARGERMQVKGLFLNYKKNRRLMQYFFKIRELV